MSARSLYIRAFFSIFLLVSVGCGSRRSPPPGAPEPTYSPPESRSLVVSCYARKGASVKAGGSLVVPLAGEAECLTERFRVGEGHHSATMEIELSDLQLSKERPLESFLNVELSVEDKEGEPVVLKAMYRDREVNGALLNQTLKGITDPAIIPKSRTVNISLIPAHYPFDAGWIPSGAESGRFIIRMKGPGEFLLHSLTIERTKWNMPLARRIALAQENQRFFFQHQKPEALVVASSQGTSEQQDTRLREFGPLLAQEGVAVAVELRPSDVVSGILMDEALSRFKFLRSLQKDNGSFEFGALYHPYWDREGWETSFLEISDPAFYSSLERVLRGLYGNGAQFVIVRADDILPTAEGTRFSYQLASERDRATYRSLAQAHAEVLNRAAALVAREFAGREIYFVPPWYSHYFVDSSGEYGSQYLEELGDSLSPAVGLLWTGPSVRSLSIDELEYRRYSALVGGRSLSLWDNTLYARRHKDFWGTKGPHTLFASNLEPYDVLHGVPYTVRRPGEPRPLLYLNGGFTAKVVAQILTANEYAHSPRSYDAERSLRNALQRVFGEEESGRVVELDREYWKCRAERGEECEKSS